MPNWATEFEKTQEIKEVKNILPKDSVKTNFSISIKTTPKINIPKKTNINELE